MRPAQPRAKVQASSRRGIQDDLKVLEAAESAHEKNNTYCRTDLCLSICAMVASSADVAHQSQKLDVLRHCSHYGLCLQRRGGIRLSGRGRYTTNGQLFLDPANKHISG